ncbi:MAG: FIST signal transduction protein [Inquilinaceae bacterium]
MADRQPPRIHDPDARFRAAWAQGEAWGPVVKTCLDSLGDVSDASLGILYVSDRLADEASSILTTVRHITGVPHWIGTVAMGVCAESEELFDVPAIAVMTASLDPDSYLPFRVADGGGANQGLDPEARRWIDRRHPPFGLIHADPRTPHVAATIAGLADDTGAFLVGGLTSSRGDNIQFFGDESIEGAVAGALFGPEVEVMTAVSQGCMPIGPARQITEADGNVIRTIDDRPALEVFKEDIGELLTRDLRRIAGYIFAALPVAGSDTGDYVIRNMIGIDITDGSLAIGETVETGRSIQFARRDRDGAEADMDRMLAGLRRRLDGRVPRAALYVSCLGRGPNLFGDGGGELSRIRTLTGDAPLIGFFANGEVSSDRLYGYTGVLTLFL